MGIGFRNEMNFQDLAHVLGIDRREGESFRSLVMRIDEYSVKNPNQYEEGYKKYLEIKKEKYRKEKYGILSFFKNWQ